MILVTFLHKKNYLLIALFSFIMIGPMHLEAQRLNHGASRSRVSRPAPQRSAPSRSSSSRNNNSRNIQRPTSTPKRSINGGSKINRPSANKRVTPTTKKKLSNKKSNNKLSGNKVNVDKSKRNVNVNVDNSKNFNVRNTNVRNTNVRNTRVRANTRRYVRPPYHYGGFHFYAFRPYYYHPYRPFYWGPVWHPWGFFITTLATTAIIVSVENQKYHYDSGVYYQETDGGYTVVQAPVGATVKELPKETEKVEVNETTNNYYYGGAFYEKSDEGYTVVPATAGTIVPALPEGGEEVRMGEQTYVKFGDTYYQPIQLDGKDMYEIVEMKDAE